MEMSEVVEGVLRLDPVGRRGSEGGKNFSLLGGRLGGRSARVLASRELDACEEPEESATGEERLEARSLRCRTAVLPLRYSSDVTHSGLFDCVKGFG